MDIQAVSPTRLAYPVSLQHQHDTVFVSFPDVPEALTEAATEEQALSDAVDCLVAALGGYVQSHRRIPAPSSTGGSHVIELTAMVTAKLALYEAMQETDVDDVALAKRLGTMRSTVRRLVDLDRRSHIDQIAEALDALGKHLVVEVFSAA